MYFILQAATDHIFFPYEGYAKIGACTFIWLLNLVISLQSFSDSGIYHYSRCWDEDEILHLILT
jgi:hypothetical protein